MIIDLNTSGDTSLTSCDLCIVGSGAAGLAIASEMLKTRLKVVILESGGMDFEPSTQALYNAEVSGLPHPGTAEGRFRVCGGSTTKWGGQALPLMPSDFENRVWVSNSGWPITFEKLKPFYQRAYGFLLTDQMNLDSDLLAYLKTAAPDLNSNQIWYHFSKWSPKPSVRDLYLPQITASDRCTLLLHANVTAIRLDQNLQRVESIQVSSLGGTKAEVRARIFVICAGGIETARLLLVNNQQQPQGIGNHNDLVGRFFQDHPNAMVGRLDSPNPARVQKYFNVFHKGGRKYSVRLTATPQWQRTNQTLNTSTAIIALQENEILQDLKDSYTAIRNRHYNRDVSRKLMRVMRHPSAAISPIWHYVAKGRSYAPGAQLQISSTCEQEPNRESRVLLSDRTDALGIRQANVRWRLTDLTRYTMQRFAELVGAELQKAGFGKATLEKWLLEDSASWVNHIHDQYHHMGTARMHESAHQGVVNKECLVHGMSNLYVGSSAVFPTSGHSNPTLTIIALCLRLADRLRQELE